ncbi:hypothetical protein [Streptacidiphilus jiangxiensis]|uniref:Low molecular weight antigen MTB12-like C-terminal domain-containing protein n=1 Tax=Streptacidiphilus jiangxiensis TaxID=235985 RepID=A0A1H8A8I8_STRJI|nr:hypothetical protein [Streptacidiphilus jiangxiensis]SEM67105.1 hypothetical protein SAMN05414137_14218 [Streptacidiphilus jiangxiensis]
MERASLVLRTAAGSAVLLLAVACSSSPSSTAPSAAPTTMAASAPATTAATSPAASAAAAGCGNGTAPTVSGSGPADTTGAAGKIATDYAEFFDPATSLNDKMALVENAQKVAPAMQAFAGNPQAAQTSVAVTGVDFTSASSADITYNVCLSGAVALKASKGKSVLDGGVWKVSDTTLCGLLQLQAGSSPIPGCS